MNSANTPSKPLRIVVASGKGGTGKTTIATSLALSLVRDEGSPPPILFIDCDVEAPNAHLFLHPDLKSHEQAVILIPEIVETQCNLCGKCVEVCQFHALARIGKGIIVFPQLCHGCGSCTWNCPQNAIIEKPNPVGLLEAGFAGDAMRFTHGMLTISEPMATPVIRQLKKISTVHNEKWVIIDSPPGASCSAVETMRSADFALLVTEPTPFGLHDLRQILGIVREACIPAGVVINRDGIGDSGVDDFLHGCGVPVLLRIPYDPHIASGIAAGCALIDIYPEYAQKLRDLYDVIKRHIKGAAPFQS